VTANGPGPVRPETVADVVSLLADVPNAFLVGGQALNFWAERYTERFDELGEYGPFVSKDVDFYGPVEAARRLAKRLNGKVRVPKGGDFTPQSAIVEAKVGGAELVIDFLWHVIGPPADKIEQQVVTLDVPATVGGEPTIMVIAIMHPLHCFQSRAANVVALHRTQDLSLRQLNAAIFVVRGYIEEALEAGQTKVASSVLEGLGGYLLTDPVGRRVREHCKIDPVNVIAAFRDDARLDQRYRDNQIASLIDRLEKKRR